MTDAIYGTDWSQSSIDLIVADYFEMLRLELSGQKFNKAERNRAMQDLTGRVRGSVENKHRNVSAVLEQLGLPQITGYKPLRHFQNALIETVDRALASYGKWLLNFAEAALENEIAGDLAIADPPARLPPVKSESLRRLVRKFDPAKRDAQIALVRQWDRGERFKSQRSKHFVTTKWVQGRALRAFLQHHVSVMFRFADRLAVCAARRAVGSFRFSDAPRRSGRNW